MRLSHSCFAHRTLYAAGVLLGCGQVPQPAAPSAEALASVPSANAPQSAAPSAPPPSPDSEQSVSGYLGGRGIIGTLSVSDLHWRAAFHFVDGGPEIVLQADAVPQAPDLARDEELTMLGRKVHPFLDCGFKQDGGPASVPDARCLAEDQTLEIDGTWSNGTQTEPFYLRTRSADGIDVEDYLAPALAIPTPKHDCAPFVEVLSVAARSKRTSVAYRLSWLCDEVEDPRQPNADAPARQAPPSYELYLADVTPEPPHQLLWSSKWATLADQDDTTAVRQGFSIATLTPDLELYIAHVSDDFHSPTSSGGNSAEQVTLWVVDGKGLHGNPLALPATESGHTGWCFSSSTSSASWLVDLNGDKLPELVTQVDQAERHDAPGKDGNPECVDEPIKTTFLVHQLNPKTLNWTRAKTTRRFTEQQLQRGEIMRL